MFDILVSGRFPGSGSSGPISYPNSQDVRQVIDNIQVVNLAKLIELKLAATRYQDFADVVSLIDVNKLDESFVEQLHPAIRKDYLSCVDEQRREAEYKASHDSIAEQDRS